MSSRLKAPLAAAISAAILCSGCVMVATHAVRAIAGDRQGGFFARRRIGSAACDAQVPPLASGYGADGPYASDPETVAAGGGGDSAQVFLPRGASGPRPVIFLAHGYGPNYAPAYQALIDHLVSRGTVVVFGTFPMRAADMTERYAALWNGFTAATRQYGVRMDLGRVGFVGHSFGGGATPALARKGLAAGWGGQGAFVFLLAPWYAFDADDAQLQQYPANLAVAAEVYDKDTVNDHRMAIDLYDHMRAGGGRYFFRVKSLSVNGCEITADHSTPARHPSLRLKQYAVFRPLDALIDAEFTGSPEAHAALAGLGAPAPGAAYEPLVQDPSPRPDRPEASFAFKWSGLGNPRREEQP